MRSALGVRVAVRSAGSEGESDSAVSIYIVSSARIKMHSVSETLEPVDTH